MGAFLEWIKSTEFYKDEKLWTLFCAVIPSVEAVVGGFFAVWQWKSRSKLDRENKVEIAALEAKFEEQLKEKDLTIKKLVKSNDDYKEQSDQYKSKYGKLKVRR